MLPSAETAHYWYRDHVIPVEHTIEAVNPCVEPYAKKAYGGIHRFLETVIKQVSVTQSGEMAFVHPTSGRALVQEIQPGLIDPYSHLPCFVVDVKGSGLTYPGYLRNEQHIHAKRTEYIQYPNRPLQGALTLTEAALDFTNTQKAQDINILTPLPIAVVRPTTLFVDGKRMSIDAFRDTFGLPHDFEPAFYVRAWPVTSTRLNDILPFPHCDFPYYDDMFSLVDTGTILEGPLKGAKTVMAQPKGDSQRIALLRNARRVWKELEYPFLKQVLPQAATPEMYSAYVWGKITQTLTTMFRHRLSPCTGKEDTMVGARHMHLQNWTTIGALTEWSVITQTDEISPDHRKIHVQQLIQSAYDATMALSLLGAPHFHDLPDIEEFASELPVVDALTQKAIADFLPNPVPQKTGQVVWIDKSLGSSQTFLDWLKANQQAILA